MLNTEVFLCGRIFYCIFFTITLVTNILTRDYYIALIIFNEAFHTTGYQSSTQALLIDLDDSSDITTETKNNASLSKSIISKPWVSFPFLLINVLTYAS